MSLMVLLLIFMLIIGIACGFFLAVWSFFFAVLLVFMVTVAFALAMGKPILFTAFSAILVMQIGYFAAFLLRALFHANNRRDNGDDG